MLPERLLMIKELVMESQNITPTKDAEMDFTLEIKEDPELLETELAEIKSEPEDHVRDADVKNKFAPFVSHFVMETIPLSIGPETVTKAEIKKESFWPESGSLEPKLESEEALTSAADFQNEVKDTESRTTGRHEDLSKLESLRFTQRKGLTQGEIERLLLESSDEEDYADFFDSDDEAEIIETTEHSSESEQSCDDRNEVKEIPNDDCHFYIGKDQETLWISNPLVVLGKTKCKNITKVLPGPKLNARETKTEIESFLKFFDPEIIDSLVVNTNRYINNKKSSGNYKRDRDWRNTSASEIMALLGVLFLIAIQKGGRTNVLELWASNGTGVTILRAAFSYKRFLFLLRSLRFDNTSTRKERLAIDKLAAIRDLHSAFLNNCINNYCPGKFTTIGEMLVPFRGRCGFVQYMPNKRTKYGLKLYALCDSKTFYTCNFEVYCGRQNPGPYLVSNQPMDIVKRLVEPIKGTHRNVTMNNYYSSYPLAQYLLENGLTFIATLKKNKKEIPPEFLPNRLRETGNCLFGFQDDFCLVSYQTKRNKAVLFLSSMHETDEIDTTTGKSIVNLDYNATKGGVDTVDYMCTTYSTQRTIRRWPLALFFRYLDIAGINSQVLFFANNPEKRFRRRAYLTNLALALMESHLKERAQLTTLPRDIQGFLSPYRTIPESNEDVVRRCGRCHLCSGRKNKTTATCNSCKKFVCKQHCHNIVKCNDCIVSVDEESV